MVRINLVDPRKLSDQHLIAEYNEILMLLGYVKLHPTIKHVNGASEIPQRYTLGKGHILFFKDKLIYLQKRHESIKMEMRKRGFRTDVNINLRYFPKELKNDWKPVASDIRIIKERLIWKLQQKPDYYRYYGEHKRVEFFLRLLG